MSKLFDLTGKVAVVTGGARGLGMEMSKGLAEAGADVAIMYVHNDSAHDFASELAKEYNVRCKAYQANITDSAAVKTAVDQIYDDFGAIHVFVANAGVSLASGPFEDYSIADWLKTFDINVNGVFYSIQAASKYMLKEGKCSVIITSSISAAVANRPQFQSCYNASKGAVSTLTKCLATEWAQKGIRVNAICPAYMKTDMLKRFFEEEPEMEKVWSDMTPMGRLGEPSEVKGSVVFLASDASSYITGTELFVDGGYTAV